MWSGTDNPRGFGGVSVPVHETASYRGKLGPLLVEATHSCYSSFETCWHTVTYGRGSEGETGEWGT